MTIVETRSSRSVRAGRKLLWLSAILALGSLAAYLAQILLLERLTVPWYLAALGSTALIAAVVSFFRAPSIRRALVAVPVAAIAAVEVWIVTSGSLLPVYDGPVKADAAFPAFSAVRASGGEFTEANLRGQPTVLTFFRGRW